MPQVTEIRVGRNFIREGDRVKVLPSRPSKRDGFIGKVLRLFDNDGDVTLDVYGGPGMRCDSTHTLPLARVRRIRQTKLGEDLPGRVRDADDAVV